MEKAFSKTMKKRQKWFLQVAERVMPRLNAGSGFVAEKEFSETMKKRRSGSLKPPTRSYR